LRGGRRQDNVGVLAAILLVNLAFLEQSNTALFQHFVKRSHFEAGQ
jgi:hypothetical protein